MDSGLILGEKTGKQNTKSVDFGWKSVDFQWILGQNPGKQQNPQNQISAKNL